MDIDKLRARLMKREGQWFKIAAAAGCDRTTLYRVIFAPDYNPTMRTLSAIEMGLKETPYERPKKKPRSR